MSEETMSDVRYVAQVYRSEESLQGPHATTPDENLWIPSPANHLETLAAAVTRARGWSQSEDQDMFKTARVLEVNPEDLSHIAVVWASAWEKPLQLEEPGASRGIPGETIKMQVWMHRDAGPPDHWGWQRLRKLLNHNANAWDLVYGREIDRRGKEVLWSIRMNIYPDMGSEPIIEWNWWKIIGYDRKKQADKVDLIRSHEIEPRGFPSGVETTKCTCCGKTIEKSTMWATYNSETDQYDRPFCSCYCIDEHFGGLCEPGEDGGIYEWRVAPSGEEFFNENDTEENGYVNCEWKIAQYVLA